MQKTLFDHHRDLRIELLRDDPRIDWEKRLAAVERMAAEHGWRHLCERECIEIKTRNIYTA